MAKRRNRRYERVLRATVRYVQRQSATYRALAFGAKPKRR